MSFAEILEEIPKLSFEERQEVVRRALALDEDLTVEEDAILDARMEDFRLNPNDGVPLENVMERVKGRISSQ